MSNQLSDGQKWQLWQVLREQQEAIHSERPTLYSLAEQLSEQLGFKVTEHNLEGAIESKIINGWEPAQKATGPVGLAFRRLSNLERDQEDIGQRLEKLEETAALLDRNLTRLYRDLGMLDENSRTPAATAADNGHTSPT